jgi:hypothetical protein
MLDYLHIPKQQNGNIDYFPGISNTDGGSWVAWEKPKGTHMIRITCIGGGGGGGSGYNGNPGSGGGGGGSSAISIVTIPAYVLPDILYVSSGVGGNGGVAPSANTATPGSNGIRSYVSIAQDIGAIYCVCYADCGKAPITLPSSSAGGGGGVAALPATIVVMLLASYGIRNFIAGQTGGAGGSPASNAGIITYPTTGLLLSGGVGGSGSQNSFGGVISTPAQTVYTIFTTPSGGVNDANNTNSSGVEIYQPLLSCGGSSAGFNAGGGAGDGGFGSGGAGSRGGAGALPGGKGGNGLVIIHSW